MSEALSRPRLAKWPFYLADAAVSAVAVFVLWRLERIEGPWETAVSAACLAAAAWGAWLSITPWLSQYRGESALAQNERLQSAVEQIRKLEEVAALVRNANSQWQGVQDASARTVQAANDITERMKVEAREFITFLDNAQQQEKAAVRLEVEKLRRMEGEWLKTCVQILDHVFALNQAARRSGQESLIRQLDQFQGAVREIIRRMGLTPFVPELGESFNPQGHQLPEENATAPEGAKISQVLATGFTYQGQLLRRSLVLLATPPEIEQSALEQPLEAEPSPTAPGANAPEPVLDQSEPENEETAAVVSAQPEPADVNSAGEVISPPETTKVPETTQSEPSATEFGPVVEPAEPPSERKSKPRRPKDNPQLPLI